MYSAMIIMLECIELSSMVDFSMGGINLMLGYMISGHGTLHVLRAYSQLKHVTERGGGCVWSDREVQGERTHAGAGSRRHPAQGVRPRLSKAVVVHGRVGAGIKGVQPPSCVIESERQCTVHGVHQLCLSGSLETSRNHGAISHVGNLVP